MTLTEIAEIVARRIGAEEKLTYGFIQSFIETLVQELDRGNDVKIRGLGTFQWVDVPEGQTPTKKIPAGKKLKFKPSRRFSTRRCEDARRQRRNDKVRGGEGR